MPALRSSPGVTPSARSGASAPPSEENRVRVRCRVLLAVECQPQLPGVGLGAVGKVERKHVQDERRRHESSLIVAQERAAIPSVAVRARGHAGTADVLVTVRDTLTGSWPVPDDDGYRSPVTPQIGSQRPADRRSRGRSGGPKIARTVCDFPKIFQ